MLRVLLICTLVLIIMAGFYLFPTGNVSSGSLNSPLFAQSLDETKGHLTGPKAPPPGINGKGGSRSNMITCEVTCGPTCNQTTCGTTCVTTCVYTCSQTCNQTTCTATCVATCAATCANTCTQMTCEATCLVSCSYTCSTTPITLVSFAAQGVGENVILGWITASEVSNYSFVIRRSTDPEGDFAELAEVLSHASGNVTTHYAYEDGDVEPGTTYYYTLSDVSLSGDEIVHPGIVSATPGVAPGVADGFVLLQNYPNPFNQATKIRFIAPAAALVKLDVYNVRGRQVRVLLNDWVNPGANEVVWDATDQTGQPLPSGVYVFRLTAGEIREFGKMMLVK